MTFINNLQSFTVEVFGTASVAGEKRSDYISYNKKESGKNKAEYWRSDAVAIRANRNINGGEQRFIENGPHAVLRRWVFSHKPKYVRTITTIDTFYWAVPRIFLYTYLSYSFAFRPIFIAGWRACRL